MDFFIPNTHESSITRDSLTWSFKQPLIPGNPPGASFLHEVQDSTEPKCRVSRDHFQLGHHLLQDLSRVEGERILGQTDLLVGMTQLDLQGRRRGRWRGGKENKS